MSLKRLNREQIKLLEYAQNYCDENDKSEGFMLQFMENTAGVDLNIVLKFLEEQKENGKEKSRRSKNRERKDRERIMESNFR